MTNIIKTIESFREFWFETFKQTGILNEPKNGEVTRYNIFNYRCKEGEIIPFAEELEAFIIKALKAQEQEHQKKLEELESGINKLDEDIKYYSNKEYRANFRSEAVLLIKETFRTINKT